MTGSYLQVTALVAFWSMIITLAGPPADAWLHGPQPWSAPRHGLRTSLIGRALGSNPVPQVETPWSGTGVRDLHNEYGNIFPHGNRNAASHRWSSFILKRSEQMTHDGLIHIFTGFCSVSGSPVNPDANRRWILSLDKVDGSGKAIGMMYYCCWPCICDTQDFIKVDTKTVVTSEGPRVYRFAVIGNPCQHPQMLTTLHDDPFGRGQYSLAQSAPDLTCEGNVLDNAVLSDHGFVIIGMFHDFPHQTDIDDGRLNLPSSAMSNGPVEFAGTTAIHSGVVKTSCDERAAGGYASGMGTIFRLAANINPIPKNANVSTFSSAPHEPNPDSDIDRSPVATANASAFSSAPHEQIPDSDIDRSPVETGYALGVHAPLLVFIVAIARSTFASR